MWASLWSGCLQGFGTSLVQVEADLQGGLPSFCIVGLPDAAVKESRERIRSALKNSNFSFPMKRITINLPPAHIKKEGSSFDLAMALVLLMAHEQWDFKEFSDILFLGELSLKGGLNAVRGILPLVLEAKRKKFKTVLVPLQNVGEAAAASKAAGDSELSIYGIQTLSQAVQFLKKEITLTPVVYEEKPSHRPSLFDFSDVNGQRWTKKALEVSAAGGHHLLMLGPPGCGKSMLARCMPSILPSLSFDESLEVTRIYSVAGLLRKDKGLMSLPPFRSPHHTISYSALVGGGTYQVVAGEIRLWRESPDPSCRAIPCARAPMARRKDITTSIPLLAEPSPSTTAPNVRRSNSV